MGLVRYNPAIVCISGKLGDLVFYTRNGTHCVRTHVVPNDPKTEKQVARRKRFATLVARWRAMKMPEKQAWNERARGSARTGFNEFLSVEMKRGEAGEPILSSRATAGSAAIFSISGVDTGIGITTSACGFLVMTQCLSPPRSPRLRVR